MEVSSRINKYNVLVIKVNCHHHHHTTTRQDCTYRSTGYLKKHRSTEKYCPADCCHVDGDPSSALVSTLQSSWSLELCQKVAGKNYGRFEEICLLVLSLLCVELEEKVDVSGRS